MGVRELFLVIASVILAATPSFVVAGYSSPERVLVGTKEISQDQKHWLIIDFRRDETKAS